VTTRETNANRQHQQRERERETFKKRSNRKKKERNLFCLILTRIVSTTMMLSVSKRQ